MPGSTPAPSFTRISIGVTSVEQVSGITVFRCTGNTNPGFVTGDTATISGNSVAGYNTDHTVTGTGTDGTGPYVKIGFTTHTSNGSGGLVYSQRQPVVDLIGKSGANNVQIIKSGSQHVLSLLEGGQGGGGGGGGGSNTLDAAYDQGGAGSGRTVQADSGPVTIVTPASSGSGSLLVSGEEGSQSPVVINHTDNSGSAPFVTAPALFVSTTRLNAANVEIMDVQGAIAPSTSATKLFTVYGSETVVNDSKVDHDFRVECLSSVANGPHTVANSLVHEASTGRLGLGIATPDAALHIKHKATAGLQVTGTESATLPFLLVENNYTQVQRSSGGTFLFVIQPTPNNSGSGGSATVSGYTNIMSSGYVQVGSSLASGESGGAFNGWLHRMDNGFSVGTVDTAVSLVESTCVTIGEHAGTAGVVERSLVVGRDNSVNNDSLAVGADCNAATQSVAIGVSADTTGYPASPVIALNNGSSAGGGGGSTANTVVIDSGNQAPGGAISIGGAGGNGNVYLEAGVFASGAADYAEMFEWADGNSKNNPNNAVDRRGLFVHLDPASSNGLQDSMKIVPGYIPASAKGYGAPPIGVVSGRPVILGDAGELQWTQTHEVDDFGATKYQVVKGKKLPKVNPNYNPNKTYQPRSQRVEWTAVGMLGKLFVRTSGVQPIAAGDYVTPDPLTGMAVPSPAMGIGTKSNYPNPHAAHQSGTEFHYLVLRVMRQATKQQYGIVEILLK